MPTAHSITFIPMPADIDQPQIKFGGQPDWIDKPAWPLSRSAGTQMQFIAQFDLSLLDGYTGTARWAYLFMTDGDDEFIDGTWKPDGGENCLLLQPGNISSVETIELAEGPTLYKMVQVEGHDRLQPQPCCYGVKLEAQDDPDFIDEDTVFDMDEDAVEGYRESLVDDPKIGGTPEFLQGDSFPDGGPKDWLLLHELSAGDALFYVNFGDLGVGYAFVRKDGTDARFLWQC